MSQENKIRIDVVQDADQNLKAHYPESKFGASLPTKMAGTKAPLPREETQNWQWANWGADDKFPTRVRCKLEKSTMATSAIEKLVAMMHGNGLCYHRNSDLANGNTKIKRAYIPEVEAWLKRNRIATKWFLPQLADYRYYMNTFSEMILSKDKKTITTLAHKPAEFCRLSKMNEKTLNIEHVYFSPDFVLDGDPPKSRYKKIPLFRWYDETFFNWLQSSKFIYHSKFETPGTTYYARPFWLGLFRDNGWLDVSAGVPEIVNSMMRNQVILKYQILIPESYFTIRYHDWDSYTDEKRAKLMDDFVDLLNDELSDTNNLFKSIATVYAQDQMGGEQGKVQILAIDDKTKKDHWVPSSNAADAQIIQGLGLHPSQLGLAPEGGKMGAGSGSDQRESYNTQIALNTIHQNIVLEPLNFIAEFNAENNPDWDITFFIDHTHHTTTNIKEDGTVPSENTLQVV